LTRKYQKIKEGKSEKEEKRKGKRSKDAFLKNMDPGFLSGPTPRSLSREKAPRRRLTRKKLCCGFATSMA
jgi:hypothetical protein